jgi:hypothetical protein
MATLYRWENLQLHQGSPQNSFELLCALLARRDERFAGDPRNRFVRNGRPDGGVECYWELADGSIHGYQAKYHRESLGSSQWQQLKDSIQTALKTHPRLTGITVCLPQDLPNSPIPRGTKGPRRTGRIVWDENREAWQGQARKTHDRFTLDLWDDTAIASQLQTPQNLSLLNFFFGTRAFTPDFVKKHVAAQTAYVGPRYQPTLHVAHDLESIFQWLTMTSDFREALVTSLHAIRALLGREELAVLTPAGQSLDEHMRPAVQAINSLVVTLRTASIGSVAHHAKALDDALYNCVFSRLHAHRPQHSSDKDINDGERYMRESRWRRLEALREALVQHLELLGGEAAGWHFHPACDGRLVAVSGSGGCGKTHSLCELASTVANRKQPVVLLLGQSLDARYFRTANLIEGQRSLPEILDALNIAGEVNECRGLLIIDALNEATSSEFWAGELRAVASSLDNYPNVAVLVSVRDSYADRLLPEQKEVAKLLRVQHNGFRGQTSEALSKYCGHYNITLPDVPTLNPEFDNPLFLSMFCQAVAGDPDPQYKRHAVPFPGGHLGFGQVFEKFIEFREKALIAQFDLDLDTSRRPLRDALGAMSEKAAASPALDVSIVDAKSIAHSHLRSNRLQGNILARLEADGLILKVPRWLPNGQLDETVRFAYDRMGSHLIVSEWLKGHTTSESACAALFGPKGRLRGVSDHPSSNRVFASLCEQLVLVWPEVFQVELFDHREKLASHDFWREMFLRALCVSSPSTWSDSTARWLRYLLEHEDIGSRAHWIATYLCRVGHSALVDYLHCFLIEQPLAVRDAEWTIWVNNEFGDSLGTGLVSWPLEQRLVRLSETQAEIFATSLAWLTSTTHRGLRASATKAIVAVLDCCIIAGTLLLHRFKGVNDPYILQAVSLAVYGACLRSSDTQAICGVADAVQAIWPTKRQFPLDVISRHALSGIVELAVHRNQAYAVNLKKLMPPYESEWIDDVLDWKTIDKLADSETSQNRYAFSTIVRSCMPEGLRTDSSYSMYGNFGRYVVGWAVSVFLPRRSGKDSTRSDPFEHDLPHRYIITRALSLGWTSAVFEKFDRSCGSGDRGRVAVERIGKKYQWIALSEFLARASDRFPLAGSGWPEPEPVAYVAPADVHQYFFADTSLVHLAKRERFGKQVSLQSPGNELWSEPNDEAWLLSAQNFIDPSTFLIEQLPEADKSSALMRGRYVWRQDRDEGRPEFERHYRTVSMTITAFAIRREDLKALDRWFHANKANGKPDPVTYWNVLFGELFWSRAAGDVSSDTGSMPPDSWKREQLHVRDLPVPLLPLAAEYATESDDTIDGRLDACVPSHWLAERLGLRAGPSEFTFTDKAGTPVWWQLAEDNDDATSVSYVDLNRLTSELDHQDLQLIWWVTGEKMAVSGEFDEKGPVMPFLQGLYWLGKDGITGWSGVQFDEAFRDQRERLYPEPFTLFEVFRTGLCSSSHSEQAAKPRKSRRVSRNPGQQE